MVEINEGAVASPASVRYHGLDALRAWAMSMGIVLHAAWIMIPGESGAPMTDASASPVTDYICLSIHTFRMQLFFVLAGLFACLLLRKRGFRKFSINRTLRIALPLVVFWMILCPIMIWQYKSAGIASGAIQGDQTAWELTKDYFANLAPTIVLTVHLWFLYYLAWVYVLVLAARGVLSLIDRHQTFRDWISAKFGAFVTRPWAVLVLAALFAPMMMAMKGPWGIEITFASLYLEWPGLLTYTAYFVAGWLIFRNVDKLSQITCRWRWQLALGLVLIVPYYFYAKYATKNGYATWNYPQLVVDDFRFENDKPVYPEFRSKLMSSDPESLAGFVWKSIPEANRTFVEQKSTMTENQLNGLLGTINAKVLAESEMTEQVDLEAMELSEKSMVISKIAAAGRTVKQNQWLNRELLNAEFVGIIYSEDVNRPYYYPIRAAYCFSYSVITWLLIFGCIGFSQHYFDRESRFWRYFSDSSYWFYLAHLPIQFQLLLWLGAEPWHPAAKFTMYVVVTTVLLLVSYHFLIRPTWVGWFLNGRMASVWKRAARALVAEPGIASGGRVALAEELASGGSQPYGRADEGAPEISVAHAEANRSADNKLIH